MPRNPSLLDSWTNQHLNLSFFLAYCPPSIHISFDRFSKDTLADDSGSANNAFLANGAQIEPHAGHCGNAANLLGKC